MKTVASWAPTGCGLPASRSVRGSWAGSGAGFDEDVVIAAIRRARELGVNFFDTARAYGFGASERLWAGLCAAS